VKNCSKIVTTGDSFSGLANHHMVCIFHNIACYLKWTQTVNVRSRATNLSLRSKCEIKPRNYIISESPIPSSNDITRNFFFPNHKQRKMLKAQSYVAHRKKESSILFIKLQR
jgi:hypothetical protein